jgi:hypothetical protein
MDEQSNVREIGHSVRFSIDGEEYETTDRRQPAADLLRIGGLDPGMYDLGELRPGQHEPVRYRDEEIVTVRPNARFVSIRQRADVA